VAVLQIQNPLEINIFPMQDVDTKQDFLSMLITYVVAGSNVAVHIHFYCEYFPTYVTENKTCASEQGLAAVEP